jgi:uncharacterized iron-regulated protein
MKTPALVAAIPLASFLILPLAAQDSSPGIGDSAYVAGDYRVYSGDGTASSIDDIVVAMGTAEVVFVGETHDDPTGHFLEAELFRRAYQAHGSDSTSRPVALSLEFFQRDAQPILDEYLGGLITEKAFLADSRPWPRYHTDYRPMIEFAKEQDLAVIAANTPRRYANRVSRLGRESLWELGPDALATIAPLPYGQPSKLYRDQWIQVIMAVMEEEGMKCGKPIVDSTTADSSAAGAHQSAHGNMGNQLHSQVLWDATMAYWINDQLVRQPDALVLHMVGSFHVARGTGIPEQLERYRPGTTSIIVMLRPVEDITKFEAAPSGTWGDFVIQTDQTRTLEAIECREEEGKEG